MLYDLPHPLPAMIKHCEINDSNSNLYNLEFDFNEHKEELNDFLLLKEFEIPDNSNMMLIFNNKFFKYADMVNLNSTVGHISYEFFVCFMQETCPEEISLKMFVHRFLALCNENNINAVIEMSEPSGYYLKVDYTGSQDDTIGHAFKTVGEQLHQLMQQALLDV